jgi:hypothetical protein
MCLIRKPHVMQYGFSMFSPRAKLQPLLFTEISKFLHNRHFVRVQMQIWMQDSLNKSLDIVNSAKALLVDFPGLLCIATLTASMFWAVRTLAARPCFRSKTEPFCWNCWWSLWMVFGEGAQRVTKWARKPLCVATILFDSTNNNTVWTLCSTVSLPFSVILFTLAKGKSSHYPFVS